MTDSTILSEPMPESSTVIEPRGHDADPAQAAHKEPDAPEPKEPSEPKGKESRLDTIKRAAADLEKQNPEAKAEAKPEAKQPEEKSAEPEVKQPVKADSEPVAVKENKPSEGRKIIEAPARFLPRAKELWNNVPHPVREEFDRVMKEAETEKTQYVEAKQFKDELAEYDTMAKQSGTTVKAALQNYVAMEQALRSDPSTGFKQLMQNMGMHPVQVIGHILRAAGATPEQLVSLIQRDPSALTSLAPQQMPQRGQQQQAALPPADPRVDQLERQLAEMKAQTVAAQVIAPFAEEYPEYYDHEDQIAKVLKSGIIEQIHGTGLSPRDKLEAALFMVAPNIRRSGQSAPAATVQSADAGDATPAVDLRGTKSVKGSPSSGADTSSRRKGNMSRNEAIAAAAAELGIRL